MKKRAVSILLAAALAAGALAGCGSPSGTGSAEGNTETGTEEGKVINIIAGMMNSVSVWKQFTQR